MLAKVPIHGHGYDSLVVQDTWKWRELAIDGVSSNILTVFDSRIAHVLIDSVLTEGKQKVILVNKVTNLI